MEESKRWVSSSTAPALIFFLVVLNVVILRTAFVAGDRWYLALIASALLLYMVIIRLKYLLKSKSAFMQKLKENNSLVIRKDDYQLLSSYLKSGRDKTGFDRQNAEDLETELKKAKVVSKNLFPSDVVRINSLVRVKEQNRDKEMAFQLVTPDKANIRERKISIMAPMGTALLGFRQGQEVNWRLPSGSKTFTIVEVINAEE